MNAPRRATNRVLTLAIAGFVAVAASSCIRPHKIDIQQGNVVTNEQLTQLKAGMSKRDARFIMGTPLVEDPFHDDRWIYYYSFKPGQAKSRDQQAVTLVFEADTLSYVEADTELENVPVRQLEPLDTNPQDDKGFFSRWFGRD